eukprot:2309995-Rhodomonas_salina.2
MQAISLGLCFTEPGSVMRKCSLRDVLGNNGGVGTQGHKYGKTVDEEDVEGAVKAHPWLEAYPRPRSYQAQVRRNTLPSPKTLLTAFHPDPLRLNASSSLRVAALSVFVEKADFQFLVPRQEYEAAYCIPGMRAGKQRMTVEERKKQQERERKEWSAVGGLLLYQVLVLTVSFQRCQPLVSSARAACIMTPHSSFHQLKTHCLVFDSPMAPSSS